jgi:release factor glutamine methyltransferase
MSKFWTIKEVLNWTTTHFQKKNISEARLSAELLLCHLLKCKRLDLYLRFDQILTKHELTIYRDYIEQRLKHKPVQYILGEQEFMGLSFKITPDVLIPRPETEILVETVLADLKSYKKAPLRILDAGSGSGVIGISIAYFFPNSRVVGIEISKNALNVAKENADLLGVKNCEFILADATKIDPHEVGTFDFVVTNPPYIPNMEKDLLSVQVRQFEPPQALFAGEDGLDFLKIFIPLARNLLIEQGKFYSEIGYNQKEPVYDLLNLNFFNNISFIKDYLNFERIVKAER